MTTDHTVTRPERPIDILMGEYNPAFKLHFYLISVLILLAALGCVYGFANVILSGNRKRIKPLAVQAAATVLFVGMCILACFTAFWRDGNLDVAPISAVLMTVFFILFGTVGGLYAGSFFVGKPKGLSVWLPAGLSALLTLLMYVGEGILLHGHLYRLGKGLLFASLPGLVVSPFDILVILSSGAVTALLFGRLNRLKTVTPDVTEG